MKKLTLIGLEVLFLAVLIVLSFVKGLVVPSPLMVALFVMATMQRGSLIGCKR